jgi:hypothetical protein
MSFTATPRDLDKQFVVTVMFAALQKFVEHLVAFFTIPAQAVKAIENDCQHPTDFDRSGFRSGIGIFD